MNATPSTPVISQDGHTEPDQVMRTTPKADSRASSGQVVMESKVMDKQPTGGLWGWWSGSGRAPNGSGELFAEVLSVGCV